MDEAKILVDLLLEDLELALRDNSYSVLSGESPMVISLYEDLKIIKSFLERIQHAPIDQKQLQSFFVTEIRDVVLKMLVDVDSYIVNTFTKNEGNFGTEIGSLFQLSPELSFRAKQIDLYKKEILEIHNDALIGPSVTTIKDVGEVSLKTRSRTLSFLMEEKMVGFQDEATALLDRLTGGEQMQLEVISIVGMGGIGKTKLAKRLYTDPVVVHHFHVRGWATTSDSGLLEVNNILQDILSCIINAKENVNKMTYKQMEEKLMNCLKGKRYLIVIDGLRNWDPFSLRGFGRFFPNDCAGSKILLTSRTKEVVLRLNPSSPLHFLRYLSHSESWRLFESKVFTNTRCPLELMEVGKEILSKCCGLPLSIVVLAGVLQKDISREWWMHIAEDMTSAVGGEEEQLMHILAIGYEHLPDWLKPCFLHLGSFPKGYEIPVKKLVRSWTAGRFIKHNGEKKTEDVADDYLSYLVDRSLVIVSKRRSNGGIKTCYIHDFLWDLCLKKAKDNMLLRPICIYEQTSLFSTAQLTFLLYHAQGVPDLDPPYHFFDSLKDLRISFPKTESLVTKLLIVLDLENIILQVFPLEILVMVHLKYLSLNIPSLRKLPLLCNFWNLETFILVTEKGATVTLPHDIWKMVNLRHLHISGELEFERACSSSSSPFMLDNLQTISQLCPSSCIKDILAKMPNLVNLGCNLSFSNTAKDFLFPDLSILKLLETLKFDIQTWGTLQFCYSSPQPTSFPPSLKKLTLIGSLDWKEMSTIGRLPNLEVLKVKNNFFNGQQWETSDEGFHHLKFLKLSHTNLQRWFASSSSFPCLEHLVLHRCLVLEEIPPSIGDIQTLQMIEVSHSSPAAADSVWQIQESQKYMGNFELKVFTQPLCEVE
ncbi:putative late blight resistance protein homolog R1B-17 [Coffea eugenioides]|uniref:putative late blight resistance protein homolog R1B-17 n=1 Tax=Coffea eugenioides TaxID=49369 RepID=UPI000F60485F|nr:putative late blight resistance protein homolog R1B-17 [Coffea eugenioides]